MDLNQIKPVAQEYGELTNRHFETGIPTSQHPDNERLLARRTELNDQLKQMVGEYLSEKGGDAAAVEELKAVLVKAKTLGNFWWPMSRIDWMLKDQISVTCSTEDQ